MINKNNFSKVFDSLDVNELSGFAGPFYVGRETKMYALRMMFIYDSFYAPKQSLEQKIKRIPNLTNKRLHDILDINRKNM